MKRVKCVACALAIFCGLPWLHAQGNDHLNEGARVEMDWVNGIARLKWWAKSGRTYFVQHTTDLNLPWRWADIVESGNDSWREWGYEIGDRLFVRLRYTDTPTSDPWNDDFDGDKVSNAWELFLGTDPLSFADTDGDSMPDDWETRHGLNPHDSSDADLDPDGDGQSNGQEFANDNNPNSGDGDADNDGVDYADEVNVTGTDPKVPDPFLKLPDEQGFAWVMHDEQTNPSPWQFFNKTLSGSTYPAIGAGVRVFVQFDSAGGVVDDEFKINNQIVARISGNRSTYELTDAWHGEGPNLASAVSTEPGGAYLSPFRIIYLPAIEILDKDKTAIAELKVGKMAESGVLSGTGAAATLDIDKDSDRFYVRIPGAASLAATAIKIATVENPDSAYNDDATEIEMEVEGNDLISKSLLLVSDNVDDDHEVDEIADDAKNDRTHKIQLGGKFQIASIKVGGTERKVDVQTSAPAQQTVKVKLYNCMSGIPGFTQPILTPAQIAIIERRIKERLAQCGIKVEMTVANGVSVGVLGYLSNPPTWDGPGTLMSFPQPARDFFSDPLMPVASDAIAVYAVGGIGTAPGDPLGMTTVPSVMSASDIAAGLGNRVLLGRGWNGFTVAHELLHVLMNAVHDDYSWEHSDSRMLWHTTSDAAIITDTKRISARQSDAILGTQGAPPASTFPQ